MNFIKYLWRNNGHLPANDGTALMGLIYFAWWALVLIEGALFGTTIIWIITSCWFLWHIVTRARAYYTHHPKRKNSDIEYI